MCRKRVFHRFCLALILFTVVIIGAAAEDSLFFIKANPGISLSLGTRTAAILKTGGGGSLSADFRMPFLPILYAGAGVGYKYAPVQADPYSISLLSGHAETGIRWEFVENLSLDVFARGGYYYSFINNEATSNGGNPFIAAGGGLIYTLPFGLGLGVETSYRNYLGYHQDLLVSLGVSYNFPRNTSRPVRVKIEKAPKPEPLVEDSKIEQVVDRGKGVGITEIKLDTIYPVFFKYYNDNPIGTAVLYNNERNDMEDIRVTLFEQQYMNNPTECTVPPTLISGSETLIELNSLFTDRVMDISEGTMVSVNINLEYTMKGKQHQQEFIETLELYDRNALSWDDDRKAAAFVTAKDPTVLKFAKNVASVINKRPNRTINVNLLSAMGLYEALTSYGISYVIDPTTPYQDFSKDALAVDFLQFPSQTLEYRAGDCDDLSVLYCALLESLGIESAFITIPGHIYIAFSLGMDPDQARSAFSKPDELIFIDNETWVPFEVTELKKNFLSAWQTGAKQWRENYSKGQTGFFPVREGWQLYRPVGISGSAVALQFPEDTVLFNGYIDELTRFVDLEIYPTVAKLQSELEKTNRPEKIINKLGVLYARYGLDDRAINEFEKVLSQKTYVPSLINMGNIYFLRSDFQNASTYYNRAYEESPENPKVLLCVARVNHEIENYAITREAYGKLKEIDPGLALRFAYLDLRGEESTRAANISDVQGVVLWEEE